MEGTKEFTTVGHRREFSFDCGEILAVVGKRPPIPDRDFVIDLGDSSKQRVIARHGTNAHAAATRPPHILSCDLRKSIPPGAEVAGANHRKVIPLHTMVVLRLDLRKLLAEDEDVRSEFGRADRGDEFLGITNDLSGLPVFVLDACDLEPFALDDDSLAVDLRCLMRWHPASDCATPHRTFGSPSRARVVE